jgi:type IV secretory pathway VirB10-like protein
MFSNRIAFAVLAVVCVGAAVSGGYLATRQALPASAPADASANSSIDPVKAVQETEAVVTPPADTPKAIPPPAVTPPPAPVPRRPAARPVPPAKNVNARATEPPALEHSWPTSSASATQPPAPVVDPSASPSQAESKPTFGEPSPVPEPQPKFEELVVSADSVIGLKLEGALNSERAHVEDPVEARVVRDVRVGRTVAIPAGSRAQGSVVIVERGGKFKDRARLGIRFHTLVLADGSRLPISTDTIYRYGDAPGDGSAKKIGGGAVAGAILGAIIGGAKGAAVGATAGAGGGTAMVMSGDRSAAEFPAGSDVTARILSPVTVTVDR